MSPPCVCVVGSLHVDLLVQAPYLPRAGETLLGDAWWWATGGKGGNQAIAAARHGAAVRMLGRVGDDAFGTWLLGRLVQSGVDASGVRVGDGASGISVAIQQADGDYAAVVVSGVNQELDAGAVAAGVAAIRSAGAVALQHEIADDANLAAARLARAAGVPVILNAAPARPLGDLAGLVDMLVVNGVEAEMLGAAPVMDLAGATRAARHLCGLAPTVVVTAGAAGVAAAWGRDDELALRAHPVVRSRAHGAGDVLVGALAARVATGDPPGDALRYANAAAALHVGATDEERGAIGPADVARLLDGAPARQG